MRVWREAILTSSGVRRKDLTSSLVGSGLIVGREVEGAVLSSMVRGRVDGSICVAGRSLIEVGSWVKGLIMDGSCVAREDG